jgi:hypothetical protein
MKINSWVLESVAFGKKPIILDNGNYDGYFSDQDCFKVKTYSESAFTGKFSPDTIRLGEDDPRRSYLVDIPIKESLMDILGKIYQNRDLILLDNNIIDSFTDRHDWMAIAEKLKKKL